MADPTPTLSPQLLGIQPPAFNWKADHLPKAFKDFKRYSEVVLSTPIYASQSDETTINYILLWMGPKALEIFDSWTHVSATDKKKPTKVWAAFEKYFEPKSSFRLCRFQLREMRQGQTESIDDYVTRLRTQADKCNFKDADAIDDAILDQVIHGSAHKAVQKKLFEYDPNKLTLQIALEIARTHACTQSQLQQMNRTEEVHALRERRQQRRPQRETEKPCGNCGRAKHPSKHDCPAKGQKCHACGKLDHWADVCRSTAQGTKPKQQQHKTNNTRGRRHRGPQRDKHMHSTETNDALSADFDVLMFDAIHLDSSKEDFTTIKIRHPTLHTVGLRGKLDNGASGNVLPLASYKKLFPRDLTTEGKPTRTQPSSTRMFAYGGTRLPNLGKLTFRCQWGQSKWHDFDFLVTDVKGPILFGRQLCQTLGLITVNCSVKSVTSHNIKTIKSLDDLQRVYPDRFKGLGKLPGTCKLTLKEDAEPIIHPPRRAPIQLRDQIKQELDRMVKLGVIRQVTQPTDWVSSITYVTKPDKSLRICLDPSNLNKALKRGPHHTPTVEELTHFFNGATVFSKLDLKSGYWSVVLDEASQLLTTFNTPFGRFCYCRLPMGLVVSQDVFQKTMDDNLQGLPGVIAIADDITVYGRTKEEHDTNLLRLMSRAKDKGMVFNPTKCSINKTEIQFFGQTYDKNGVKPDKAKVQAINDLKPPQNVSELRSLLGMITYMGPFIPKLSETTACLRALLQQTSAFKWQAEHQQAFLKLKSVISNASYLRYFDPEQPAVVQVDASQFALGAALTQNGFPIAFASKTLTDTEQRYANIERELLACVFGAERFHTYLFGKSFTIESDHKPLEMIVKKPLYKAPARLQRMLLRLQGYDYKIVYKPGEQMVLADSLSRLPVNRKPPVAIPLDVSVNFVQFSSSRLQELKRATHNDIDLSLLKEFIYHGFPLKVRELPPNIQSYWSIRDELSLEDGLIIKGNQVVIPQPLQKEYLDRIHTGHQGIIRCQQLARSTIYWPGIMKDIENLVSTCESCQKYQSSLPKDTNESIAKDIPNVPWHTISTDLFYFDGEEYLIIADYYTKYFIVEKLTTATSKQIANLMHHTFARFGPPHSIISDNGPQFIGQPFKDLMRQYDISHVTSSHHHPQSHGFIERMIRSVKNLMKKSKDFDAAFLQCLTTPRDAQTPSAAELMFGRKIRNNLPAYYTNTAIRKDSNDKSTDSTYKSKLDDLHMSQPVYFQDVASKTWSPGTIIGIGPEPQSYTLECSATGRHLRRNRTLLRPRAQTHSDQTVLKEIPIVQVQSEPSPPPATPIRTATTMTTTPSDTSQHVSPNPENSTGTKPASPVTKPVHQNTPTTTNGTVTRSGRTSRPPTRLISE